MDGWIITCTVLFKGKIVFCFVFSLFNAFGSVPHNLFGELLSFCLPQILFQKWLKRQHQQEIENWLEHMRSVIRGITAGPSFSNVRWLKFIYADLNGIHHCVMFLPCVPKPRLIMAWGNHCEINCPEDTGSTGYFLQTQRFELFHNFKVMSSHIRLTYY